MGCFEHAAVSGELTLAYNCEVTAIARGGAGYSVEVREPDGTHHRA